MITLRLRTLTHHLKLIVLGGVAVSAVAGCANMGPRPTAAEQELVQVRSADQTATHTFAQCMQPVLDDPAFAPLKRHMPPSFDDVTLEQMSETAKATAGEAKLLSLRHDAVNNCRKQRDSIMASAAPAAVSIRAENEAKSEQDLVSLIQRKITWGDYLTRIKQLGLETRAKLQALGAQQMETLRASDQAERADRQRQFAQQMHYYQQQQLIQQQQQNHQVQFYQNQQLIGQMNRPMQTNCSRMGSSINCTTQ